MAKELEPMEEKVVVRLLVTACMPVVISINANMPREIIMTVITVRSLLLLIFFQESDIVSLKVIKLFLYAAGLPYKVNYRKQLFGKKL